MNKKRITILYLTASLSFTGTHRILSELIKSLDKLRYRPLVAYKPQLKGPGNDLTREIQDRSEEIFHIRGDSLFSLSGIIDLYKILRKYDVDIIHCWDSFTIAGRIIGKLHNVRVIDSLGNPPIGESWKTRIAKKVTSLFLDGVIFQSKESMQEHFKNGANLHRLCKNKVIYNCIDFNEIPEFSHNDRKLIREKYKITDKDILLTNLGMYNEQKAQEFLIKALPSILTYRRNVRLFLVGWGENTEYLKNLVKELNLINNVIITGKKQRDEVFEILSITDIYVSASLWEGLPIAVLEAMAFKLPVVATDVIGNREAIVDTKSGYLVKERDPAALSKSILKLIKNPNLRNSMGIYGQERVINKFSKYRFIEEHEDFYDSIIRQK